MTRAAKKGPLKTALVYTSNPVETYTGSTGDYLDVGHKKALALNAGTVSLSFSLDRLAGDYALISKDGTGKGKGGDFTLWIEDGAIILAFETTDGTEYLRVPDLILSSHTTYQLGFSFGKAGLNIWLNGELVATEPEFTQGIAQNNRALVVGGSRAWHDPGDPAHSLFKGSIGDVMVFDRQLGSTDMINLANAIDPALAKDAKMHAKMAELAPVFEQMHHASDTLKEILSDYGVSEHGHMMTKLNMITKGKGNQKITGTDAGDGINGGRGNDSIQGGRGDDVLQGDYGNDKLQGGTGNDILDGGHGEDKLFGGKGNDLLISRADAREPKITYNADRDEADPYNELTNGKLYPNQPIPGDDVLTGGAGADTFYFQTLINAKKHFIQKHTNDDGTINWHGVAGENDNLHDHWVDTMGNDVITDYSRSEGDKIVIEGHTTRIASIRYGDANGDGVMDHSVIRLYSEQGNAGAHNKDLLGTITVYGDLVKLSDIQTTDQPAYGIIKDFDDLRQALAPTDVGKDTGRIKPPKDLPTLDDMGLPKKLAPVVAISGTHDLSVDAEAPLVFDHTRAMDLTAATVALSFTITELGGYQALFSKDVAGNGDGGHITAYINPLGHLIVRLQDKTGSHYLDVKHAIKAGGEYDLALSFGDKGAQLYLNGARVAYETEIDVNWADNTEVLIVGGAGWNNESGDTDRINSYLNGTITDFMLFDQQLTSDQIFGTDVRADYAYFKGSIENYRIGRSANGETVVTKGGKSTTLDDDVVFSKFNQMTVRSDNFQFGSNRQDTLMGQDGSDVLMGLGGDDDLRGNNNDDLLLGGGGDDSLFGGNGRDILNAGNGNDRLFGGTGNDVIKGGAGDDYLYGDEGNDKFYGGIGDDYIAGHAWNDGGKAANDRVYFDGNFADFKFETKTWFDSNRDETVTQLIVTDRADGGIDGLYEGKDRLIDIDTLVFADQAVAFDDLL